MQLKGLHHITAVTGKVKRNVEFYTQTLGLRLVKKSVNQDDTSAYHLFYADKLGTPGTDITFFDWPHIGPNQPGTDSIAGTAFRVSSEEALDFWTERLEKAETRNLQRAAFNEKEMLSFQDPEGQQLYLVNDGGALFEGEIWSRPDIPDEFALRGFYAAVLSASNIERLSSVLVNGMNFTQDARGVWIDGETPVTLFRTHPDGGPGSEIWLKEETDAPQAQLGTGGVHHVAFRVEDVETQEKWRSQLTKSGLHVTRIIDRFWFKSIYFRVSRGILFEIATEGPGFAIDEEPHALGEKLVLPPFLESQREEIESQLTPIGG